MDVDYSGNWMNPDEAAVHYGPQPAPEDYRIANRPGNPHWRGVKAWFDDAAGVSLLDRILDAARRASEA
mgnify:FL=1